MIRIPETEEEMYQKHNRTELRVFQTLLWKCKNLNGLP